MQFFSESEWFRFGLKRPMIVVLVLPTRPLVAGGVVFYLLQWNSVTFVSQKKGSIIVWSLNLFSNEKKPLSIPKQKYILPSWPVSADVSSFYLVESTVTHTVVFHVSLLNPPESTFQLHSWFTSTLCPEILSTLPTLCSVREDMKNVQIKQQL